MKLRKLLHECLKEADNITVANGKMAEKQAELKGNIARALQTITKIEEIRKAIPSFE